MDKLKLLIAMKANNSQDVNQNEEVKEEIQCEKLDPDTLAEK